MFIKNGGLVGINTENPHYQLDVNGLLAVKGMVGSFTKGNAYADAKWHTLTNLRNLSGCIMFEIIAHINDNKEQRYGLTLATLMLTQGKKGYRNKVYSVSAGSKWLWGKFMNKIQFRWVVDDLNTEPGKERYMLQMRSKSHYGMLDGKPKSMFYRVRKLWDKEFELDEYPETKWDDGYSGDHIGLPKQPGRTAPSATIQSPPGQRKTLTIKKK